MISALALALLSLTATDVDRISQLDQLRGERRHEIAANLRGKAPEMVRRFLRHNVAVPRNTAWASALREVADPEAAILLADALVDPPDPVEGVVPRHWTEVDLLLEAALDRDTVASSPAVALALRSALEAARRRSGQDVLTRTIIGLLGQCRSSEARELLRALATEDDVVLRRAAVEALGSRPDPPDVGLLRKRLFSDASPEVRAEAARTLARLGDTGVRDSLRRALDTERAPPVVDALVSALRGLGESFDDPRLCRDVAARCREARIARPLFECWRRSAGREELLEAAVGAPPALRVLALGAFVEPERGPGPLHRSRPWSFDDVTPAERQRLVSSTIDVLGRDVAVSTYDAALEVLWSLSRQDMTTALGRIDGLADADARYWASARIAFEDREAYADVRRRTEWRLAGITSLPLLVFVVPGATRRTSLAVIGATALWAASSLAVDNPLDLPPWPFLLTTPRLVVCAAAAIATIVSFSIRGAARRLLLATILAPALFLAAYWITRRAGFHPPDTQSGYAFVFEPLFGLVTSPVVAFLLHILDRVALTLRRRPA